MTKFIPMIGIAAAGMLAGAVPATAAPMFETAQASTISGAPDMSAHQYRDRDRRDDRGYRDYNRGNNYNNYNGQSWRGRDGRYYCKRNDGTTGLLIGESAAGLIGNQIAGRGDRTLGTILGVAGGALLGREVDRGGTRNRCR